MSRLGFVVVLVAAITAVSMPVQPAVGSPPCERLKGTVDAQLRAGVGEVVLHGVVQATLGGVPVTGSILTRLSTPLQGIDNVANSEPTKGFGEAEVEDFEKRERKAFATTDSGLFVAMPQPTIVLLVIHAQLPGPASGEIHYQGVIDLEKSAAAWDISGVVCL